MNEPCIGHDSYCPCQDGDSCHYKPTKVTPAWPIPEIRYYNGDGNPGQTLEEVIAEYIAHTRDGRGQTS